MCKLGRRLRWGKLVRFVGGVFAVVMVTASGVHAGEKVRWKMHSAFGSQLPVVGGTAHNIAEQVAKMSGGDFKIKVFEPGALAGGYAYYDPIAQGAFEAAYGSPGANQSKSPALAFASSWPFGPGIGEFLAWLKFGGGEEIISEIYARDNIKYFMCGLIPPETSGWFREPVTSVEDLSGLKMRFSGMGALVMQKLGVSTQLLAGGDIYPALELGTIDATEFMMPAIDRALGFFQVAKYNYFPGWHQQSSTSEILIGMKAWTDLPPEYQAMFETACTANVTLQIAEGEAAQYQAMMDNEADGVTNVTWPDDILDKLRAAWAEVLEEQIAGNEDVARLWASYDAFHKKYQIWGARGYLK